MGDFPSALIVGAPKCGTTSLFNYLGSHPQIYPSPEKEPHFYSYIEEGRPHYGTDEVDEYTSLFQEAGPEQLCIEASTWYLYSRTAARQIRRYAPDTKCIAILRQPVDRAYSSWSSRREAGFESLSFSEAIAEEEKRIERGEAWGTHYLRAGLYSKQVRRFYEQLGQDQVRIFWFDDLKSDSRALTREALSFLGLESDLMVDAETVHNPTYFSRSQVLDRLLYSDWSSKIARRLLPKATRTAIHNVIQELNRGKRPSLDKELRATLTDRIWPDVERLEGLLDVDLSRWATQG